MTDRSRITGVIDTTCIVFRYDMWTGLKGVKSPQAADFTAASTNDNRALRYSWHNNPPPLVNISLSGNAQARDRQIESALETLSQNIRTASRVLYIGRATIRIDGTTNPDPRMLIAVTGVKNNFRVRVYGYR